MKKVIYLFVVGLMLSCSSDSSNSSGGGEIGGEGENPKDSFNRKEMLTFWADKMIIPAYTDYVAKTKSLQEAVKTFTSSPNLNNLELARKAYRAGYISWQKASLYHIGKAEQNAMTSAMNTYPTVVEKMKAYIKKGSYSLDSPNLHKVQGFPAVDYLLYGMGTLEETVNFYNDATNENYKQYINDICTRIHSLTNEVLDDWKNGYREIFIEKDGYSETSSVDKMVNFFVIPFYEKQFREPKIASPTGYRIDRPIPTASEAYYAKDFSKELYITTLNTVKNFFRGIGYNGEKGKSLQQYLEFLKRDDLVKAINQDFENITELSNLLEDNFEIDFEINKDEDANEEIIIIDKVKRTNMFNVFDAIQSALKKFKPDMMSAMSIKNTSTDADND